MFDFYAQSEADIICKEYITLERDSEYNWSFLNKLGTGVSFKFRLSFETVSNLALPKYRRFAWKQK